MSKCHAVQPCMFRHAHERASTLDSSSCAGTSMSAMTACTTAGLLPTNKTEHSRAHNLACQILLSCQHVFVQQQHQIGFMTSPVGQPHMQPLHTKQQQQLQLLLLLLLLVQSCTCMARMQYPSTPPHTQVCRERGHHLLLLVHTEHTRMRTRLKQHTQQIGRK
jgi:hypothetical protein